MNDRSMPILTIQLDEMRRSMRASLMQSSDEINRIIQITVDAFCTEENLKNIINEQVRRIIPEIIKKEIESFFRHGPGGEEIKNTVAQSLRETMKRLYPEPV